MSDPYQDAWQDGWEAAMSVLFSRRHLTVGEALREYGYEPADAMRDSQDDGERQ